MAMTDAQARAYIQGEEPFDEYAYARRHAENLCKSVEIARQSIARQFIPNLIRTAKHYARDDSPYMQANPEAKSKLINLIHEMEEEVQQ